MTSLALVLLQTSGSPMEIAKRTFAEQRAAFVAKDADRIAQGFAKDFVYIDNRGKATNREAAIQGFRSSVSTYRTIRRYDVKIVNAHRTKKGIVAVTDAYFDVDLVMNNKPGHLTTLTRSQSLLVPGGKGWLFRYMRVLDSKMTLPGRSMLDAPSG